MVDNSIGHLQTPFGPVFCHLDSPDSPPHLGVRLYASDLRAPSPISPRQDTATALDFPGSQAEAYGKGQVSNSRVVQRRWVLSAAMAGVRCRQRCGRSLPPRLRGCTSLT